MRHEHGPFCREGHASKCKRLTEKNYSDWRCQTTEHCKIRLLLLLLLIHCLFLYHRFFSSFNVFFLFRRFVAKVLKVVPCQSLTIAVGGKKLIPSVHSTDVSIPPRAPFHVCMCSRVCELADVSRAAGCDEFWTKNFSSI